MTRARSIISLGGVLSRGLTLALALVLPLANAGCRRELRLASEDTAVVVGPSSSTPAPIPDAVLDEIYSDNRGLLRGIKGDGVPVTAGSTADPLIAEARRYYDTIRIPRRARGAAALTAPATFEEWKSAFGFPAPHPGESKQAFRDRAGVVLYYNRNELGLGRELGCVRFTEVDARGEHPSQGIACYVTNYGHGFGDRTVSLPMAIRGTEPRNTVCIIYRPSLGPSFEIQFYVFGAQGRRQEWAQLDTLGSRPHPLVCMNCHGGGYDSERHLAKNARFLPLDPSLVDFADEGDGLTRASQEERIRAVNALAADTPLTGAQRAMLTDLYAGRVATPGQVAVPHQVPEAWRTTASDREFYDGVVKPYCATCHLAAEAGPDGRTLWSYRQFQQPASFDGASLVDYVCEDFSMPNAQATSHAFWSAPVPVAVAGRRYPSAADAFLARAGIDRTQCANLAATMRCDRGRDPDALCGDGVNGLVCDRRTGRCGEATGPAAHVPRVRRKHSDG